LLDGAPAPPYGFLEIGIALLALLTFLLLIYLEGFYAAVARAWQPGLGWLTLLRLIFSVLALVPTTILIGATMPVMSRIYATRSGEIGGDVGR
jgi:hypothetical protein